MRFSKLFLAFVAIAACTTEGGPAVEPEPNRAVEQAPKPVSSCGEGDACAPQRAPMDAAAVDTAERIARGGACASPGECVDGTFCVDGVCCEQPACGTCEACGAEGKCAPVTNAPDDDTCPDETVGPAANTCGKLGCDAAGACRYRDTSFVCGGPRCWTSDSVETRTCDGMGSCSRAQTARCMPGYQCAGGVCATECTNDDQCLWPKVCVIPPGATKGSCGDPKGTLGMTCGRGSDCFSGFCVDGICCDGACGGVCQRCGAMGLCAAVTNAPDDTCPDETATLVCGRTGRCDAQGKCALRAAGTVCGAPTCAGDSGTTTPTCNGAGSCSESSTAMCKAGYRCGGGVCPLGCTTDAQCAGTNVCTIAPGAATGSCVPARRPLGQACSASAECTSGNCVDGRCCSVSACAGCQACGPAGTCVPAPESRDARCAKLEAQRARLIDHIWPAGKPAGFTFAPGGEPRWETDLANWPELEGWYTVVFDLGHGFTSSIRLKVPKPQFYPHKNELIILHPGHDGPSWNGPYTGHTKYFISRGYHVLTMSMLFHGDNSAVVQAVVPGVGTVAMREHQDLAAYERTTVSGIAKFLDHVVQAMNWVNAVHPNLRRMHMTGLSGGGWTTSMVAAIDPRIHHAWSVSGAIYDELWGVTNSRDRGDYEHSLAPWFLTLDIGYADIFALAASNRPPGGLHRLTYNKFDYYFASYGRYAEIDAATERVKQRLGDGLLGRHEWQEDATHGTFPIDPAQHMISPWTLEQMLNDLQR